MRILTALMFASLATGCVKKDIQSRDMTHSPAEELAARIRAIELIRQQSLSAPISLGALHVDLLDFADQRGCNTTHLGDLSSGQIDSHFDEYIQTHETIIFDRDLEPGNLETLLLSYAHDNTPLAIASGLCV
ncbi:MAG: hypothetical protein HN348_35785 [Proteobacteria bacterium]|jgi:hypothetical protein|nr:hypothetical protein [Pseudomonadota bacterium]